MKLGFFDSGIGGLSVLYCAMKMIPQAEFLYYADEENVPYGTKSKEEIIEYTDRAIRFLADKGAQAVVVACNTATSAAIKIMREKYDFPIIGMEPAVKKAIDLYGEHKVLTIATPITVVGQKMKGLIERVDKQHQVDLMPLPKLVTFAERCEYGEVVREYLRTEFASLDLSAYGSLVLGCTHFNLFKDVLRDIMPPGIHFVDGNEGTIKQLMRALAIKAGKEREQTTTYYFSGKEVTSPAELQRLAGYLERLAEMATIE
ncbi:glutamate racemase [Lachnospiraceae bacterium PF1-21]|uniref:glutamate racemase n=1 Tax=Ohessyouella blattaphilus TaxID=2949333 RepID=UPI002565A270|nr:glutamate racemase [Lachnospiraceae bacterium OttesenSCG-928-J05]